MNELANREYWNKRALAGTPRIRDVVFYHHQADEHEAIVMNFLRGFKDKSALDVCCGYGRFSEAINNYTGVDFSEGMLEIARQKYPNKTFRCLDARTELGGQHQIVFEVISLSSLGLTPKEFFDKYRHLATEAVVCIEHEAFYYFPIFKEKE